MRMGILLSDKRERGNNNDVRRQSVKRQRFGCFQKLQRAKTGEIYSVILRITIPGNFNKFPALSIFYKGA
jgi:hypothetical protein